MTTRYTVQLAGGRGEFDVEGDVHVQDGALIIARGGRAVLILAARTWLTAYPAGENPLPQAAGVQNLNTSRPSRQASSEILGQATFPDDPRPRRGW